MGQRSEKLTPASKDSYDLDIWGEFIMVVGGLFIMEKGIRQGGL